MADNIPMAEGQNDKVRIYARARRYNICYRADYRFAPIQWETWINRVSNNLQNAMILCVPQVALAREIKCI